jgi:hypothetical protein
MLDEPRGNGADHVARDAHPSWQPQVGPKAMAGSLATLEPSARDTVQAKLRPALARWCDNVIAGVERNERNAMTLYAKAMGVVGADYEVNINVLASKELGMSIDQAKRKLGMVTMVEGIDLDGAVSMMELHVRDYYRARGMKVLIVKEEEAAA